MYKLNVSIDMLTFISYPINGSILIICCTFYSQIHDP